jgi:hypothetical protein
MPPEWRAALRDCLEKLDRLYPVFRGGFMDGDHIIGSIFWIRSVWSHAPDVADIIIVSGPTDSDNLGLPLRYEQTGDTTLLAHLIPIGSPYPD